MVVCVFIILFCGINPGLAVQGLVGSVDHKYTPFADQKRLRMPKTSNGELDTRAIADVLDTPIDVLREQCRLAKILDDDSWRQNAMRSSVTASVSGSDSPGVEMPFVGDQDERTEDDDQGSQGDQDDEEGKPVRLTSANDTASENARISPSANNTVSESARISPYWTRKLGSSTSFSMMQEFFRICMLHDLFSTVFHFGDVLDS